MCMSDITKYNCVNLREPKSCLMFHVVRCVLFLFSERSEKCVNKNAKEKEEKQKCFPFWKLHLFTVGWQGKKDKQEDEEEGT